MEEKDGIKVIKINVFQTAMTLGTYLGLYIILVYALMGLTLKYSALSLVALPLLLGIPVVAFFLIKRFRDTNCKPFFPFPVSWMITILTFLFATALSCMTVYLYLRFIDNGALAAGMMEQMDSIIVASDAAKQTMTNQAQIDQFQSNIDMFKNVITWFCSLSPSAMTKQFIQSSLVWGNILSLIIGIIATKRIRINR